MALARARRGDNGMNYWPGFVDALSTLILGIIFLLTVFVVVQFYLQQEVAGKDTALQRLNAQIAQLTDLLSLEKGSRTSIEEQLAQLRANLTATESERDRFKGQVEGAGTGLSEAQGRVGQLATELEGEKRITARALAQVEVLNQQIAALRRQLAALESALDASERKDKDSQTRIADLGQRLNLALAQRVQELSRYRSDFFGKLREILGNRPDVRIVGDRFVLQSELFFDTGKAELLPEARTELEGEKRITARALAQVEVLNQQIAALRRQLAALESALDASERKDKESQTRIADLGQRLNLALAQRVQELSRYRSDFFGRLREILGNRPDIRIVGDRFVLQSELLFDVGKADLKPEARAEIDKIATALLDLAQKIPADIAWVLRVDGHTDVRPISGTAGQFKSNWDLSAARAIAVVQYLVGKGVLPHRLVAAGFGEFQPIDPGTTDEAFSRNRRIEFKLTER